ncbi:uncharacterized protein LOC133333733, partial [Musca vetustissima]|uniref:uncharacterized protein LOC133333733 n=1 Tax=Musca vetustissima TaxID=27455 RepID=UPI002AB738EA
SIVPLIVMLFAGGWSDRYNKRKACMIIPIIGDCIMFVFQLVSAIFFDKIPMEFGAYNEQIVPSLFGGSTLLFMAVDSYMTISTPEADRVFRFGIYSIFISTINLIGSPISGTLFKYLGYTRSFIFALSFEIFGLLYVIFRIKELKPLASKTDTTDATPTTGTENPAYEVTQLEDLPTAPRRNNNGIDTVDKSPTSKPEKRNALLDFFDPTLVVDYVKFAFKKRPNRGRMLLLLLIMAVMFIVGPGVGEGEFWKSFTFKKLNWNGDDYSAYSTFNSALTVVGTLIGSAIFSKFLKLSDAMVAIVATLGTALSRVLFAFSSNTATFYAGAVADSFGALPGIAIKTMGSGIVDADDLSKLFSLITICQPLAQPSFVPIYSSIYENTVNSFPGTIFLVSVVFSISSVIVFIRRNAQMPEADTAGKVENGHKNGNNAAIQNGGSEMTSL